MLNRETTRGRQTDSRTGAGREYTDLKDESISQGTQPVHEVRLGRVVAAIWITETENGVRHNVTVSRLYKEGDQWRRSMSFGRDDLPLVCKTVDRAHDWIFENIKATRATDTESS